jgi:aspartyl-tRNA(Asn)/glutamyl-tRNA(Gln) amidotransferase subunit A
MNPTEAPTAADLARDVLAGRQTCRRVAEVSLANLAVVDQCIHAFVGVLPDRVALDAAARDADVAAGTARGTLTGVPIAWKDNLVRAQHPATAGSRMLHGFVSPFTATSLARLERQGAVLLGRTNMDEFGMGSSTETSVHGPTHNPWRRGYVPGGSSGGSAAAVAADMCPIAVGSDTGGSIRQPAALCGVAGLKPTYGRVSRSGLIAYASSLDCVGACARTAEDLALWLDACSGPDPADPTSRTDSRPVLPGLRSRDDLRGLTIGVPWQLNGPGLDPAVTSALENVRGTLRDLGARLVEAGLPHVTHAVPAYYLIATAEASTELARYDGVRYGHRRDVGGRIEAMMASSRSTGFGDEVQLRILLGTFALRDGYQDQWYGRAQRVRRLVAADFAAALRTCDLLLCPTSPTVAFPFGSRRDDPLAMYLCDVLTVPASLAGLPAISLPCGLSPERLPIGMQLTAAPMREDLLLQVAHVWQSHTAHHRHRALP